MVEQHDEFLVNLEMMKQEFDKDNKNLDRNMSPPRKKLNIFQQ